MARTSSDVMNCSQPNYKGDPCCPDCGALECLCRPRFFAGQLLSEQDLNRLDQYIKNKNRLHNRNQHGWGVVNGLLVLCDPCGEVKVTQGYAVDPCGDDIVVCEDTRVNICELIRKCKQAEPQPQCQPFHQPPNANCNDIEEEWVLTIKYREWASRGVTALRGNTCSTSGCTCGAASGNASACSCGGNGSSSRSQTSSLTSKKNRAAPQQCEPTVTCEGYGFDVYKKPITDPKDDDDDRLFQLDGAFWDAFNCCAEPLMNAIPPMPDLSNDDNLVELANAITRWCCQFRENLINYFLTHRNTSCEIIDHLRAVNCPSIVSPKTFIYDFMRSFLQLLAAWAEGIKNCLCLSLLPPPPQATCDVRVPLATVRIRARDCHVLSICNWTQERKIMITWPAMSHWLGIIPIGDLIRELLDRMCCMSLLGVFDNVLQRLPQGDLQGHVPAAAAADASMESIRFATAPGAAESLHFSQAMHMASGSLAAHFTADLGTKMNSFSTLVDSVLARGDEPLELGAILNSVSPRFKLPDNGKHLNSVEAKNLPMLLMSEVMVKPVLGSFLGSSKAAERVAEYQQSLGKTAARKKSPDTATSSGDLQQQMDDMRVQIQQQEAQIKTLMSKLDK